MERTEERCRYCGKLLGRGTVREFEIKCPRCKTLNHLRAACSPNPESPDGHQEQSDAEIYK